MQGNENVFFVGTCTQRAAGARACKWELKIFATKIFILLGDKDLSQVTGKLSPYQNSSSQKLC